MVKKFFVSTVLGLFTLGLAADAQAGWGSWGGSYGSYGGYGSSGGSYGSQGSWGGYASSGASTGGSWGGSSGGSNGSWGGHHYGLFTRWHARRAARQAYYASSGGSWGGSSGGSWGGSSGGSDGSWGGSYGSQGSWGGSYGSHGSSGGSAGTWYDEGTVIEGSTPGAVMESQPMETKPAPADKAPGEARRDAAKGILTVSLPAEARVEVNGLPTTSTGTHRRYASHGLQSGESYRYEVKALLEQDGRQLEQTKVAVLRAGEVTALDFDFQQANEDAVETSLTVHVPENAKVFLSGNATRATGPERRFSTTRISQGEKWADYLVRVTIEQDGRTLSKEQRVTLNGGDQAELNFDFDQTELADVR